VWWIGARLVEERERACDEEVLRQGNAPEVYAESILRTCEFYIASPLPCVSGVTGSELQQRIEHIMTCGIGSALAGWRKLLVVAVTIVTIAGPVTVGALNAPPLQVQGLPASSATAAFEVASIKQNRSGDGPSGIRFLPGGQYVATNVSLRSLIATAYGVPLQPLLRDQLVGAPGWIDSDRFDIVAKADGAVSPGPGSPLPSMIRALLMERFNLSVHNERRDVPIYALVAARSDGRLGPQLKASATECGPARGRGSPPVPIQAGDRPPCGIRFLIGNMSAGGVTMAQFANALSRIAGRIVLDRTGLTGGYDLDLTWTPDQMPAGPPPGLPFQPPIDPDGPSIVTAVQEQLGLKLDSQRGAVDVVVIDRLEKLDDEDEFETPAMAAPPPPPPPPPPPGAR
jgi:uncharacterized protein (TIGR03435 family)